MVATKPAPRAAPPDGVERRAVWRPQPGPQTAAITCPVEDLFYGGARGGGKTDFLLGDWAAHAGRYGEHSRGILFRKTYKQLADIIERSKQLYRPLGWTYNGGEKEWRSPEGAILRFRYLKKKGDAEEYQGHAYTWLGFEELTNWPSAEPMDLLRATLRSAAGVPCVCRSTGNPGGPGHAWVKERYIDPAPPFTPFRWQPQPDLAPDQWVESVFIPAKLEDNALLSQNDPRYLGRLAAAAAGNEVLFRAWRFGLWDAFEGAAFSEWNKTVHVVTANPPANYPAAGGLDWGYSAPSWFGVTYFLPDRRLHLRHELYIKQKPPYDLGYLMGQKLKQWACPQLEYIAVDEDAFNVTDGGKSIGERIQDGLTASMGALAPSLIPAPKGTGSRFARKQLLHEALKWGPRTPKGELPPWLAPRLTVHHDCTNFIRTIPALPLDEANPEDVDTDAEDHPYDGFTYLLITRTPELPTPAAAGRHEDQHPGFDRHGVRKDEAEGQLPPWAQKYARPDAEAWTHRWRRHRPGQE